MGKIFTKGMALCAAAAVTVTAGMARAETLTVASSFVSTDTQTQGFLELFVDAVNNAGGDLEMDYRGGPEVIPSRNQGAAVKRGTIDLSFGPAGYYSGVVPCARVVALSNVPQSEIRTNGGWELLQECWAEHLNARILAHPYGDSSRFHVYLREEPTLSNETGLDLSGLTLRSTAIYVPFITAMGGRPTNIDMADAYASLERGVVDGLAWPLGSVSSYGWSEFTKYRIGPGFWRASSMLVINLDAYNALSDEQKAAIDSAGLTFEQQSDAFFVERAEVDTAALVEGGMTFMELEGPAGEAFTRTVYEASWAAAAEQIPEDLYSDLRTYLLQN